MLFRKTFIALILTVVIASPTLAAEKWTITSLDWQPYSGKNLPNYGKSIVKLSQALQKVNIKLEVEFLPWARAKVTAAQPGYIGYFPAWPEEVNEGFIASPPVDWSKISIMARRKMPIPDSLDSLFASKIVGLIKTYEYPEKIDTAARKHKNNIDEAPDELSLVRKLARGRCDVAITDPSVMKYYAAKEHTKVVVLKDLCMTPLVIAVKNSEDSKRILKILTKALNK